MTDPGHIHQMPLTQHAHPSNSGSVEHSHPTSGTHSHTFPPLSNAEVVGDNAGLYDGDARISGPPSGGASEKGYAKITVNPANTNLALVTATTGLTVDIVTTSLTVDNSPPSPPYPNETRPYNIALLPMIKFRSP